MNENKKNNTPGNTGNTKSDRWQLTTRYFRCLLRHRLPFAAMIVCMLAAAALEPLLPLMMKPLLDGEAPGGVIPLRWLPLVMFALVFALGVFSYGRSYLGGWLDLSMQRDLRAQMTAHLVRLPAAKLRGESAGKTTTRFMAFVPSLTSPTMPVFLAIVQETAKTCFYIGWMFWLHWKLTLVMLAVAPLTVLLIRALSGKMKTVAGRAQEHTAHCQSRLNETVRMLPLIKLAGAEKAGEKTRAAFSKLRTAGLRMLVLLSASQPLSQITVAALSAIVLAHVIEEMLAGEISKGTIASFIGIMLLMPRSLRIIPRSFALWEGMLAAAREVFGFLDSPAEQDEGKRVVHRAKGEVQLQNVFFHYEKNETENNGDNCDGGNGNGNVDDTVANALSDVSLNIAAGETIALVGKSGAGKTTLANLLPRFCEPQSGAVLLDGINARELTLESLRAQIALVPQEALLFDDTVAANIAYPDAPGEHPEKIKRALANADAEEFVRRLPKGESTIIGENGARLSGGQKQRLALARAFYRDSPIVILDEPTSALDSDSESKIKKAMRELLANRTAIIIAHRFTAVEFADRIIVLENGKVSAQGTIPHLLKTSPLFAELHKAQQLRN